MKTPWFQLHENITGIFVKTRGRKRSSIDIACLWFEHLSADPELFFAPVSRYDIMGLGSCAQKVWRTWIDKETAQPVRQHHFSIPQDGFSAASSEVSRSVHLLSQSPSKENICVCLLWSCPIQTKRTKIWVTFPACLQENSWTTVCSEPLAWLSLSVWRTRCEIEFANCRLQGKARSVELRWMRKTEVVFHSTVLIWMWAWSVFLFRIPQL